MQGSLKILAVINDVNPQNTFPTKRNKYKGIMRIGCMIG